MTAGGALGIGGPASRLGAAATFFGYRGVVVVALVAGLLWAVYAGRDGIDSLRAVVDLPSIAALAIVAMAFAATWHLARRPSPLPPAWFVPLAIAVGVALRVVYLGIVDADWVGDFQRYWNAAQRLAEAEDYHVRGIYEQRALPVIVPIVEAFGASMTAMKAVNVVGLAIVQLAGYDLLRRLHSHQAAQAFTVLWLAVPETTYSAAIPSHDLIGVVLLSIVFWLHVVALDGSGTARRRRTRLVLATLSVGVAFAYLEVARNLGFFVVLVFVIGAAGAAVLAWAGEKRLGDLRRFAAITLLHAVVGLVCIQGAMGWMESHRMVQRAQVREVQGLRAVTPQSNSLADGSYAWFAGFTEAFSEQLFPEPERLRGLRDAFNGSDFLERPGDVLARIVERSERLFALGTQYGLYFPGWADDHPHGAHVLRLYNAIFAAVFALALIVSLLRLLRVPAPAPLYLWLLFQAGLGLACVTVLFNQPRYIYPIWLVGAAAIAFEAARWRRRAGDGVPAEAPASLPGLLLQSAAFAAVAVAVTWGAVWLKLADGRGRVLADWALRTSQPVPASDAFFAALASSPTDAVADPKGGPFEARFGPLVTVLAFPALLKNGDTVEAVRTVCVPDRPSALAFHVYTPYKRVERRGAFTLEAFAGGERLWSTELPQAAQPVAVQVPLAFSGCREFVFRLVSNVDYPKESWRAASRTEIFFPRIAPLAAAD